MPLSRKVLISDIHFHYVIQETPKTRLSQCLQAEYNCSHRMAQLYIVNSVLWYCGRVCGWIHSLANRDSCPSPAKSEGIECLYKVGPTEIRYFVTWTIFMVALCNRADHNIFMLFLSSSSFFFFFLA